MKILEGVEESLVPVDCGEVRDGAPVLYQLQQVFVVLDRHVGDDAVHRSQCEAINLLHDGPIRLLSSKLVVLLWRKIIILRSIRFQIRLIGLKAVVDILLNEEIHLLLGGFLSHLVELLI